LRSLPVYEPNVLSGANSGCSSWDDLTAQGEVTVLVPADEEQYQAGWRSGRFELLNELEAKLHELGEITHRGSIKAERLKTA
jgi:hypothetical protein